MERIPVTIPGLAALLILAGPLSAQPILDYVQAPDPGYSWEVARESLEDGMHLTDLRLTSQTWQGIAWEHRVRIVRPEDAVDHRTALLIITLGSPHTRFQRGWAEELAARISAPVVILGDVPNQPLFSNLREDAFIAYTFLRFLQSGDETWPLLYPMTKAAISAMDAVQEYSRTAWPEPVNRWVVTGASKRGWTTWFTGIVAPERVAGIAPLVYDNLDLAAQMQNQLDTWGAYSPQIRDYTVHDLPGMLATREGRELGQMVDPFTLRDRAVMPKLIINGTNDPYWPLDAANIYWDELPEPKYMLYVPNGGHGLEQTDRVVAAEVAFFLACSGRATLPSLEWSFQQDDAGLVLSVDPGSELPVARVKRWTAASPSRDFRQAVWEPGSVTKVDNRYVARFPAPEDVEEGASYVAMFVEVVFLLNDQEFSLTTNLRVVGG